ncbi:hypothetical protein [Pseudomonas cremoricolorata]|uniref:hypothetical protein n=1 Tax=Pseudomonas cremoricolorata TaxID=157783 RepID=UPI00048E2D9E|nr:hypothetical protein [Pseudomonas cremoricolorata]
MTNVELRNEENRLRPAAFPSSPISLPTHLSAREALVCVDTLLKDIYQTTEAYQRTQPGEPLDAVLDSAVIAATLILHALDRLEQRRAGPHADL